MFVLASPEMIATRQNYGHIGTRRYVQIGGHADRNMKPLGISE